MYKNTKASEVHTNTKMVLILGLTYSYGTLPSIVFFHCVEYKHIYILLK